MNSRAVFTCIITTIVLHHCVATAASSSQQHPLARTILSNLYTNQTGTVALNHLPEPSDVSRGNHLVSHGLPVLAAGFGYAAGHLTVKHLLNQPNFAPSALGGTATALLAASLLSTISSRSSSPEEHPENIAIVISEPCSTEDPVTERAQLRSLLTTLNRLLKDEVIEDDLMFAQHTFFSQWQNVAHTYEAWLAAKEADAGMLEKPLSSFFPKDLLPFILRNEDPAASSSSTFVDGDEWTEITPDETIDHQSAIHAYAQTAAAHRKDQAQSGIKQVMERLTQISRNTPSYK